MEKFKPFLAIYNASKDNLSISNIDLDLFSARVFSHTLFDDSLSKEIYSEVKDAVSIVVINAQAKFPKFWYERLSQPLIQNNDISICTTLSCHINNLSPLETGDKFHGSVGELDQIIYLLQTPDTFYSASFNPDCFMIKNKAALLNIKQESIFACNNVLVQTQNEGFIQLTDEKDIGDQKPLPAHSLASLQWRLKKNLEPIKILNNYPLLDEKPIMLHICMGWGGGVHQWINDFSEHEKTHQHLILSSQGELYRNSHGESLTLHYAKSDGFIMRQYDLQTPIDSTCIKHDEYKNILSEIISQFQIKHVVVSSVIGHSMQCLQTGLPTIRVFHDYFPSWPSLIANLETDTLNPNDLDKALQQTKYEPFGLITEKQYMLWRDQLHSLYQDNTISLVAPSQSVVENLSKIDRNTFTNVNVIPHAINPLKPVAFKNSAIEFRVLVLGRINPPKGQNLLEEIISELGDEFTFVLVGAGNEGKKYLNIKNIEVVMEYENENLQSALEKASASIALITSQTSETFNYTLSELQQAGICTISTKFGALKERIIDGKTGYLCSNDYLSIANKIRQLKNNPEDIESVKKNLVAEKTYGFSEQISHYHSLISAQSKSEYQLIESNFENNIWAKELQYYNKINNATRLLLKQTQNTLEERTFWGQKLTKQLDKAANDIELERKESKHLKHILDSETSRMHQEIKELNSAFELSRNKAEEERQKLDTERLKLKSDLASVYNSRSWKVTKPLRLFTSWARNKRNALRFRLAQIKSFPTRAVRSLKTRGIKGTTAIIKGKIVKPAKPKNDVVVKLTQNFKSISIKTVEKPIVSIIIPVFNHFEHTYNCLKSISELQDKTSFEVIVIDDCSTDDTENLIKNISGVIYHKQEQNGGFIESCNTGALMSTGQYLMFLNNDTIVHQNWLSSLLEVFANYDDAGLVGSKLIYPNNQLQEAGGIVFSDASGWNYGRTDDPEKPEYNHIRPVDYCSGASILVKKKVFNELGCFDDRYKPAYYEDTDLAFGIRSIGKKVYFQPASVVTHFEGISSGTDLTQGMKKYQVVNQQKFKKKWAKQLSKQPAPGVDIELCRIHAQPKRILIFDACTPTPDQDSGSLRMINLIKILKELNYHVAFMPENLMHNEHYTHALQQLGVECVFTPFIKNPVEYLKNNGKHLDAVLLSRYYVAEPVMPFIREYCPKAKIIFDTVDLHYVRERRMAEIENDNKLAKMAEVTKEKELAVATACDVTLVVSPYEVEVLAKEIPNSKVKILTNIHEIYGCRKPFSERKDIMFIGGYQHTPNVDAIEWFVKDIFPLVEVALPELKFHIIGSKAPKHIQEMAKDNIIYQGFVEDIEPVMDDIRIAIAPLRFGAGVKGKVNMSMSYGQPVVGTKIAVEGMFTQEGVDVLMAETPQQFADQIIRLYTNEELWNTLSQGGLKNVEEYFSFDAAKTAIKNILS
ncbi:MAG: glycosyltransferase [Marinicellaceae bacterium]